MGLSKKIAYRLQTLREAAGLSQQEVADRADLSLSLVAKMEQGRKADPRASTLLALAPALGVRPGQLIEDLVKPPEGTFPAKKKKRKKKELAALVAVGDGAVADGTVADGLFADGAVADGADPFDGPAADDSPDGGRKKKKKKK
jgi:transcriptional regulator with XRE-family HTH domain